MKHLIALIIFALPSYLIRFSLFDIPFTLLEVLILLLFILWLPKLPHFFKEAGQKHPWLLGLITLFVFAATTSIFMAPDLRAAAGIWKAYFIEPIMFFMVFTDTIRTRKDLQKILKAAAASSILVSIIGIVQFITGSGIPAPWDVERRVTGLFPYPNAIGLYLAPLIPILVGAGISFKKKRLFFSAASLSLLAIIFAQTEAALISLLIGFIIWGIYSGGKARKVSIAGLLLGIIVFFAIPTIQQKLLLQDWSGTVRRLMWQDTLVMLTDNPIFGAGLSGYPELFADYHRHPDIEIFQYPHNVFLNFWSEIGLIGLIAFVGIILWFYKTILHEEHKHRSVLIAALCTSMLVLLIHGLVDVPYFKNDLAVLFWLIFGLLKILTRIDTTSKKI